MAGTTPLGTPIEIQLTDHPLTVLSFLSTRCEGCEEFWRRLCHGSASDQFGGITFQVVTRSSHSEDPTEVLDLAGERGREVLMSDEAWDAFGVFGYPYFVLIDGAAKTVIGETVAFGWSDVETTLDSAVARGRIIP
ncbi:MAG: hypothetical protein JO368_08635 [Acidimicrobiales bacterium]|nr:hypothetical protein [Acidimicrobiales bacterium]